ncbi:MAG: homoserine dehydrogenase, partial [Myxococcota bacterium]
MSNRDREVGVGLIGFGTIGRGVVRVLGQNAAVISERLGARLRLVRIADLDTETDRGVDLEGIHFDSDAKALIADPAVDIVVELIGGTGAARALVADAIAAGKHVVTANKALLAEDGATLFAAAARAEADLYFEAAVAGAIPIIRPLRESLVGDEITSVIGIVNGTTNFILDKMDSDGAGFGDTLAEAQELGYAEAD